VFIDAARATAPAPIRLRALRSESINPNVAPRSAFKTLPRSAPVWVVTRERVRGWVLILILVCVWVLCKPGVWVLWVL
jgi:hypothetical protein